MTSIEDHRPLQKAFAANADDLLFPVEGQSHEDWTKAVSRALGIPLDIFYLDQLPYADHARAGTQITQEQASERADWLGQNFKRFRPFRRDWEVIGADTGAVVWMYSSIGGPHSGEIPLRLEGYEKVSQACVLLNDRRENPQELLSKLARLNVDQIERWPETTDALATLIALHEFAHGLQRSTDDTFERVWRKEYDADSFAYEKMLARADKLEREGQAQKAHDYRESVTILKKTRALSGFIRGAPHYWNALAVDAQDWGEPIPSAEDCRCAGRELHLAVAAYMAGETLGGIHADYPSLHHALWDYDNGHMQKKTRARIDRLLAGYKTTLAHSGAAVLLPVLRHVLKQGQFEGLAKCNAELVIDAADYFCPSLLAGPVPSTQPRDPITQSWMGKAVKKWKWRFG